MQGDFPWSLYTGNATADNTGSKVYNPQPLLMIAKQSNTPRQLQTTQCIYADEWY